MTAVSSLAASPGCAQPAAPLHRFDNLAHLTLFAPAGRTSWQIIESLDILQTMVPQLLPDTVVRVWPSEEGPEGGEVRLIWLAPRIGAIEGDPIGCQLVNEDGQPLHTLVVDAPRIEARVQVTPLVGNPGRANIGGRYELTVECRAVDVENPKALFAWLARETGIDRTRHLFAIDRGQVQSFKTNRPH